MTEFDYSQPPPQYASLEETKNMPGGYAPSAPPYPLLPTAPQHPPPPVTILYMNGQPVQSAGFNETDERYMCCCGQCHSKTGATIIDVLCLMEVGMTLALIMQIGVLIWKLPFWFYIGLAFLGIAAVFVIGLMFYGLVKERHICIKPFMVYQLCMVVFYVIFIILAVLEFAGVFVSRDSISDIYERSATTASSLLITIILVYSGLGIVLHAWWFFVILNCFRCIRDKRTGSQYVSYRQQPPP